MLLIDKPKGITSFDVIRALRKKFGTKKMGHAGTLDPLASGLLLVAVGDETKKLNEYVGLPKQYEVEILVGESRTTGDMEGEVSVEKNVEQLDENKVKDVLLTMVGVLELPVPVYSAVKQKGEPLYKKVRRGERVEAPVKNMELTSAVVTGITCTDGRYIVAATMDVASGTYIRSLVEEFGRRFGYPAVTYNLRRTKIGKFDIKDAQKLDGVHYEKNVNAEIF